MTAPPLPPAPLDASEPARARALKTKVRARMTDARRHVVALRTAMADFGEDFDSDLFASAHASDDPVALNRVKAVERGVQLLYGYIAELATYGLELAELSGRRDESNTRKDLDTLRRAGVLSGELTRRLQRLRELQRMLDTNATAERVHESALLVAANFPAFYEAYRTWIEQGFDPKPPTTSSS